MLSIVARKYLIIINLLLTCTKTLKTLTNIEKIKKYQGEKKYDNFQSYLIKKR